MYIRKFRSFRELHFVCCGIILENSDDRERGAAFITMSDIQMDMYSDWLNTVKEIFRGSGHPLPEHIGDNQTALAYFMQTAETELEAEQQCASNKERILGLQKVIADNFEAVILPDIRSRTGYLGDRFSFKWVYNKGEHIIEEYSSYRIPL